jgi:hypothetical protein
MNDLTVSEIDRILGFLGYGNPAAPVWFIGLEEGIAGMSDRDVRHNLKARGQWAPVMDLMQSHLSLVQDDAPYDIRRRSSFTQVWTWIAKFTCAIAGVTDWDDLSKAKNYVRDRLGRTDGNEFMTYAMPIPESGLHTREWTEFLRDNGGRLNQALARRRLALQALIDHHKPSTVICHGTSQALSYQTLLPAPRWASMTKLPQIAAATADYGGRFFITPFFGNGQMSNSMARAFVDKLKQSAPSFDGPEPGRPKKARAEVAPLQSVRGRPGTSIRMMPLQPGEYGDGTDPEQTLRVLDELCKLGFDNEAFCKLHHKREGGAKETIKGFRRYCQKTGRFNQGDNNYFVHWRLTALLSARRSGSSETFENLAEESYMHIPPRNSRSGS